ncbi:MAG: TRAP transporter substrate-binding protein [Burkholderiaceae bacterium]|nr:TRAP transporter substrate-binding protein [Burkholderiaceae bacterium]
MASQFEFVHVSLNQKNHIDYPVNIDLVDRIKKLSNGQIAYKVFDSGVLGDERQMLEQVKSGTITTARLSPAVLGTLCPGQMVLNLPFLFNSGEHMMKVVTSKRFADLCEAAMVKEGVRPIGYWWMGVRDLYTKKPIRAVGDLKGLKVRVWEDPYVVESWKALGAIPTPVSFSELYTAMQTGVVDGGEGWAASYNSRKFHEVAPNLTKLGYIQIASTVVISEKAWQKLSPELRSAVQKAASENADVAFKVFKAEENGIYEKAKSNGAAVVDVGDIARWREVTAPVIKKFADAQGPRYADFIDWIKKNP